MMGLRLDLPMPATAVDIQLCFNCFASQPGVLQVLPVVDEDVRSRESPTPGHLCSHEMYCYIDHMSKKHRNTIGFTNHGGTFHVYVLVQSFKLTGDIDIELLSPDQRVTLVTSLERASVATVHGSIRDSPMMVPPLPAPPLPCTWPEKEAAGDTAPKKARLEESVDDEDLLDALEQDILGSD